MPAKDSQVFVLFFAWWAIWGDSAKKSGSESWWVTLPIIERDAQAPVLQMRRKTGNGTWHIALQSGRNAF